MAALRKEVKLFIVRSLAQFNTPEETARLVNEEYKNLNVSRQQCERYDPTKRAGKDLSTELKKEFEATRKDFLGKPENIPIANLVVRLQRYENMFQGTKNNALRLKIQEQAAKDMGGQFTNKTESSIKNEVSYPSGLGHFYGRKTSNPESST
ncbi:DUF2280 domain-containing protein [Acinetobacter cumulans]|uniref:DUF2280 domain-containing protein n=1 Tax=Acinetobacter cumulans TaxID=2136182 RepID=A0A498CWD5_9GAMM|nr:DUF2280 domain-containing protein [Acinetobacter cumulans]RLL32511.1 DUF2280 domain-containing protein [Acinetobacter cumulans]